MFKLKPNQNQMSHKCSIVSIETKVPFRGILSSPNGSRPAFGSLPFVSKHFQYTLELKSGAQRCEIIQLLSFVPKKQIDLHSLIPKHIDPFQYPLHITLQDLQLEPWWEDDDHKILLYPQTFLFLWKCLGQSQLFSLSSNQAFLVEKRLKDDPFSTCLKPLATLEPSNLDRLESTLNLTCPPGLRAQIKCFQRYIHNKKGWILLTDLPLSLHHLDPSIATRVGDKMACNRFVDQEKQLKDLIPKCTPCLETPNPWVFKDKQLEAYSNLLKHSVSIIDGRKATGKHEIVHDAIKAFPVLGTLGEVSAMNTFLPYNEDIHLLIITESSMLTTKRLIQLLEHCQKLQRLVLFGSSAFPREPDSPFFSPFHRVTLKQPFGKQNCLEKKNYPPRPHNLKGDIEIVLNEYSLKPRFVSPTRFKQINWICSQFYRQKKGIHQKSGFVEGDLVTNGKEHTQIISIPKRKRNQQFVFRCKNGNSYSEEHLTLDFCVANPLELPKKKTSVVVLFDLEDPTYVPAAQDRCRQLITFNNHGD